MQNRYTGDVGDFGKYGLLIDLSLNDGGTGFRLGIVWYLSVPKPDEVNRDGKHTEYLGCSGRARDRFRDCNSDLYDHLRDIVCVRKDRKVASIRERGIFPQGTVFYEDRLPLQCGRERWVQGAAEGTAGCDLVFLDPDNGLKLEGQGSSPKHAYLSELERYLDRGQSLVVYQHSDRSESVDEQIKRRVSRVRQALHDKYEVFALRYKRGTSRAFFVIPQAQHRNIIKNRAAQFVKGRWGRNQHFGGHIYD